MEASSPADPKVRATLPGADEPTLAGIHGVDSVEVHGDTVLLHAHKQG